MSLFCTFPPLVPPCLTHAAASISTQDLVETSLLGGTLSIAASIFIGFLLIAEFRSYMRFESESVMVVDRSPHGEMLRVNFNISFPALSCEYATLDVSDALGSKKLNLTKTVRKAPIDAESLKKVGYGVEDFQRPEPKYDEFFPDEDGDLPFDEADFAKPLDEASWDAHMNHYDVVIVNFFAPWCHWCQQLAPTWETVTQAVHQKYPVCCTILFPAFTPPSSPLCHLLPVSHCLGTFHFTPLSTGGRRSHPNGQGGLRGKWPALPEAPDHGVPEHSDLHPRDR